MEVDLKGTVTTAASYFTGRHSHRTHETFDVQTARGVAEIVHNVGIAPRVPVLPGDRVEVRGELVHDRGRPPLIHWTHHDPEHRHEDGFIRLRGRTYA